MSIVRNSFFSAICLMSACGCGRNPALESSHERTLHLSGGRIKTLDPALASDLASRNMVAAFYDTLIDYDYQARPYQLRASMLTSMPLVSPEMTTFTFTLRDDLYFQDDPCFGNAPREARKITSQDVVFSFLRIADGRLHSPLFWMFRGKIKGIDAFRNATSDRKTNDYRLYDQGICGMEIHDAHTFSIHLNQPDPRFLYTLAIPCTGIVSRKAIEFYGESIAEHPVGSGPFRLAEWIRDYRLILERNPEYRAEYFPHAANPADRQRPLPLLERVVFNVIKQPLSAWLLFLQGGLDMSALSKDNFEVVVGGGRLAPALAGRGIELVRSPRLEICYVGFNFADPVLGGNLLLRRAISLAYNTDSRVRHSNYQIIPAQGPIPPGVAGHDPDFRNPYAEYSLEQARELMRQAGYPDGIDPRTGESLTLTFDQNGSSSQHRQLAELMVNDMRRIGIRIIPVLNNQARFFQKLRQGQMQLFRLSWIGDYPDAENFLQLFYSKNVGSCNRVFYQDPDYDRMFEEIALMPDSPERTARYRQMAEYLVMQCPWIFESFPVSYQLHHGWVQNFSHHDFAFAHWKYLAVDPEQRKRIISSFVPLNLNDLRN